MTKFDKIMMDIHNAGGRIFYVGGYVRDEFTGNKNKDIDVEIHDISVNKVKSILSKYGKVDIVGESFGVLKIMGMDIDFAFPRTESKVGEKHVDFEVQVDPFLSLEESARRRDFTMNAIMKDVITGEIVDPFNGISDIENKVIKMIDKETFVDDNLRPLRACQFASRFNMTIDEEVIQLAKTLDYTNLSKERIAEEMKKALKSSSPSIAFNYMLEMGIINQLSPELAQMAETEQDPIWHPEGSVWNHTMQVLDMAAKLKGETNNPIYFMYFALIHDVGKINTTKLNKNGRLSAIGHELTGKALAQKVITSITNESSMVPYVEEMIEHHMIPHKVLEMKAIKLRRLMAKTNMKELLLFNICDNTKGGKSAVSMAKKAAQYDEKVALVRSLEQGIPFGITPIVMGRDLISWGFTPGPQFSKLLSEALELQMQNTSKEKIRKILTKQLTR